LIPWRQHSTPLFLKFFLCEKGGSEEHLPFQLVEGLKEKILEPFLAQGHVE
jgi:hypothetical protein